jgi:hypothetical protein
MMARCILSLAALLASSWLIAQPDEGVAVALPASHFKIMVALHSGYGDPNFRADLEEIKNGPEQKSQIPLYVAFGSDGCFSGVFGETELSSLDFSCRADKAVWSLSHVLAGSAGSKKGLTADSGKATVLVLVPSMFKTSCRACTMAVAHAESRAKVLDVDSQVFEVDLIY